MARCPRTIPLRRFTPACLLLLLACQTSPTGNAAPATGTLANTREQTRGASAPVRDLSRDEAAGGHTLRKHVGRTDAELRERLRRERNISAASTWNDRAGAEAAVGSAVAQQSSKITRWLERDSHPNLVLDYDGDSAHPFGRTLRRGDDRVEPCAHAAIVLKWDGPSSYHVLTAYPECRS
jgi:hypothetical protein